MRILRVLRDIKYYDGTLKKGEVVFVTEENRIAQGPFMNKKILQDFCEFVDVTELNQELLQRREEVAALMDYKKRMEESWLGKTVDVFEKKLLIMEDSHDKRDREWQKLLDAEREEKNHLLQQIERSLEEEQPKPVMLPREVADELRNWYNQGYSNFEVINLIMANLSTNNPIHQDLSPMSKWAGKHQNPFLRALSDGYTVEVEKTKEEQLRDGVKDIVDRWLFRNDQDDADLSKQITAFVQGFYSKS